MVASGDLGQDLFLPCPGVLGLEWAEVRECLDCLLLTSPFTYSPFEILPSQTRQLEGSCYWSLIFSNRGFREPGQFLSSRVPATPSFPGILGNFYHVPLPFFLSRLLSRVMLFLAFLHGRPTSLFPVCLRAFLSSIMSLCMVWLPLPVFSPEVWRPGLPTVFPTGTRIMFAPGTPPPHVAHNSRQQGVCHAAL